MSLDTAEHVRQTWGSHMPILAAVMMTLKPKKVIECGCGDFSTPLVQIAAELITIEHDVRWATKVKQTFNDHPNHKMIRKEFTGVINSTRRCDAKPRDLDAVDIYYHEVLRDLPKHVDFVFVDTFTAARVPAVNNLSKITDILMLHDLEGSSPVHYDYHLLKMRGWFRYRFAPQGMMVNGIHEIPSTDIFSRDLLVPAAFQSILERESRSMWGDEVEVKLERIQND